MKAARSYGFDGRKIARKRERRYEPFKAREVPMGLDGKKHCTILQIPQALSETVIPGVVIA